MKNRLTLILVALICAFWAIPIPGLDPFPVVIDDIAAAAAAAYAIYKLIRSNFQTA